VPPLKTSLRALAGVPADSEGKVPNFCTKNCVVCDCVTQSSSGRQANRGTKLDQRTPDVLAEPEHGAMRLRGKIETIQAVVFSPDGKLLAVGGRPGEGGGNKLDIWNAGARSLVTTLEKLGGPNKLKVLAFGANGHTLVAVHNSSNPCTSHGNVTVWGLDRTQPRMSFFCPSRPFSAAGFSSDNATLAAATGGTSAGAVVYSYDSNAPKPECFRPNESRYVKTDRPLVLWDIATVTVRAEVDFPDISAIAFAPDGMMLAIASAKRGIVLLNADRSVRPAGYAITARQSVSQSAPRNTRPLATIRAYCSRL
jgi:WD40 repeat protein